MARASQFETHRDQILVMIDRSMRSHAKPPSIRELAEECGVGVATVHSYLQRMAGEGLVEWRQGKHRSLRLTPKGSLELV